MGIFGNKDGAEDKLIEIVIEENPKNIHAYILAKKEIERQFSRNRDHNRVYSPQEEEEIRRSVALGIIRANSGFRYSYDDAIKPVSSFDQLTELLNGDFSSWPGGEEAVLKRFNSLLIRKTMF